MDELEIRERIEALPTTAPLKSVEYLEESGRNKETRCHKYFSEIPR